MPKSFGQLKISPRFCVGRKINNIKNNLIAPEFLDKKKGAFFNVYDKISEKIKRPININIKYIIFFQHRQSFFYFLSRDFTPKKIFFYKNYLSKHSTFF